MHISVFGLGYVGTVCCACFAQAGHDVIGVEPNEAKVKLVNDGQPPIIEARVPEMLREAVANGRLRATSDAVEAVLGSDISFICVGTPSQSNGALGTKALREVCEQIGAAMKKKGARHTVVVRSTVLPGTTRNLVIPTLEAASGLKAGVDFGIANNPEFLRESTAVEDYYHPPKTVIGALDLEQAKLVAAIYADIDAPLFTISLELSEMVKYTDNIWHAVKVAFGNEIGNICQSVGVDSHALIDVFTADTKLNISPVYLRPGFAFGGSCLPKDVRAMGYFARTHDLHLPLLSSVIPSNQQQIDRAFQYIVQKNLRRVSFLGMSFKSGTDDLRESPFLELIERLIGKGFDVRIYDPNVDMARLLGSNRDFLMNTIPHVTKLLCGAFQDAIDHAELLVVTQKMPEFIAWQKDGAQGRFVLDMARLDERGDESVYHGVNW
jgi:GDP-mannose 6-dehydrogenase